jgi:polar amino acid transport system substrate-binding protein
MIRRRFAALAAVALLCAAPALAQEKLPPLRTGVDGTFAPHAMPKLGGGIEGFQIDLFTEVARRMKREITIDAVSFSTLIPGMQSGRYDFIAAPTTVTKERAENMLFTAGYLWTAYQFGIKKGSEPIKDWTDLKGKSVSVNKGTPYETLSKAKGAELGFTVQVYDTQPDATQAVLSGRAYATLGGNTTIVYAASKNPQFVADLELKDTRAHWAAPVPKSNPKLRAELQDALDCMKKDGTIAKMSEKWFGRKPPADGLEPQDGDHVVEKMHTDRLECIGERLRSLDVGVAGLCLHAGGVHMKQNYSMSPIDERRLKRRHHWSHHARGLSATGLRDALHPQMKIERHDTEHFVDLVTDGFLDEPKRLLRRVQRTDLVGE